MNSNVHLWHSFLGSESFGWVFRVIRKSHTSETRSNFGDCVASTSPVLEQQHIGKHADVFNSFSSPSLGLGLGLLHSFCCCWWWLRVFRIRWLWRRMLARCYALNKYISLLYLYASHYLIIIVWKKHITQGNCHPDERVVDSVDCIQCPAVKQETLEIL